MSLFTDIRDTVTAPFRAVGGFVDDVFSGRNVFQAAAEGAARGFSSTIGAPIKLASDIPVVKTGLKALSPVTAGLSTDILSTAQYYKGLDTGKEFNFSEFRTQALTQTKDAAIVGGGIAAAGLVGGASAAGQGTAGLLGANTVSKAVSGDIKGAVGGLTQIVGGSGFVPEGLKDTFNDAKDYFSQFQDFLSGQGSDAPPKESGYFSSESGYPTPESSRQSSVALPVLLIGSAALYYYLKKGKK